MVLADTSVWIDYFNGIISRETDLLNDLLDEERIAIGDLIIAELIQGFKTKSQLNVANRIISRLEYFDLAGKEIAFKAADNYRYLRKKGITIRKTIDIIIATFCIENRFKLLYTDKDFDPFVKILGLYSL